MGLSTDQLIMVLNALPDPVFVLTEDGYYAGLYGHSDPAYYHDGHQLVGRSLYDVLPTEVAEWIMQQVALSLEQQRLIKVEYPLSAEQVKGLEDQVGPEGMLWFEGHIQPFPERINGKRAVIWVARNITERKHLAEELLHASQIDPLTGAYNRRKLIEVMEQHFVQFKRYGHPLSFILFDIDHFKQINDQLGHLTGDEILCCLCEVTQELLRQSDLLARFGGEEFVILLPSTPADQAYMTAERIRTTLEHEVARRLGAKKSITVSLGISELKPEDSHYEQLMQRADHALYQAKRNGRNQSIQR
ncbi:diguanylate cyclase [Thiomicrorhabdus sp. zzn3]|uniref:sensor domain-containing diguanylate cyclase n=1 Tax=Thiomicrorhabdus sp. zzn3 TaxID=3039775 RepID=UPI002436C65B|nr:diguanylate cyclase [Thiomicrorhabdus sp. zzn3]MDG6778651.1 diguanylate cyclase [Thiomicrorhabdus sp. zzn3]